MTNDKLRKGISLLLTVSMLFSTFVSPVGAIAEQLPAPAAPETLDTTGAAEAMPSEPDEVLEPTPESDAAFVTDPAEEAPASEEPVGDMPVVVSAPAEDTPVVVSEPVEETPEVVSEPVVDAATEEPVVEEPATEEPVVEEPATEEPVVEEPATEPSVVEEPATEPPVVEESATEQPVVETPATEQPVVETPVTEQPIVETPVTEPSTEVPAAGDSMPTTEPSVQPPVYEEPSFEEPTVTDNQANPDGSVAPDAPQEPAEEPAPETPVDPQQLAEQYAAGEISAETLAQLVAEGKLSQEAYDQIVSANEIMPIAEEEEPITLTMPYFTYGSDVKKYEDMTQYYVKVDGKEHLLFTFHDTISAEDKSKYFTKVDYQMDTGSISGTIRADEDGNNYYATKPSDYYHVTCRFYVKEEYKKRMNFVKDPAAQSRGSYTESNGSGYIIIDCDIDQIEAKLEQLTLKPTELYYTGDWLTIEGNVKVQTEVLLDGDAVGYNAFSNRSNLHVNPQDVNVNDIQGWKYVDETHIQLIDAAKYEISVEPGYWLDVTPAEHRDYYHLQHQFYADATVTIQKDTIKADLSAAFADGKQTMVYDGSEHDINVNLLVSGEHSSANFTATDITKTFTMTGPDGDYTSTDGTGFKVKDAGTYTITATVTAPEQLNYKKADITETVTVTVEPATITLTGFNDNAQFIDGNKSPLGKTVTYSEGGFGVNPGESVSCVPSEALTADQYTVTYSVNATRHDGVAITEPKDGLASTTDASKLNFVHAGNYELTVKFALNDGVRAENYKLVVPGIEADDNYAYSSASWLSIDPAEPTINWQGWADLKQYFYGITLGEIVNPSTIKPVEADASGTTSWVIMHGAEGEEPVDASYRPSVTKPGIGYGIEFTSTNPDYRDVQSYNQNSFYPFNINGLMLHVNGFDAAFDAHQGNPQGVQYKNAPYAINITEPTFEHFAYQGTFANSPSDPERKTEYTLVAPDGTTLAGPTTNVADIKNVKVTDAGVYTVKIHCEFVDPGYAENCMFIGSQPDHTKDSFNANEYDNYIELTINPVGLNIAFNPVFTDSKNTNITFTGDPLSIDKNLVLTGQYQQPFTLEEGTDADYTVTYTLAREDGNILEPDSAANTDSITNAGSYRLTAQITLNNPENYNVADGQLTQSVPLEVGKKNIEQLSWPKTPKNDYENESAFYITYGQTISLDLSPIDGNPDGTFAWKDNADTKIFAANAGGTPADAMLVFTGTEATENNYIIEEEKRQHGYAVIVYPAIAQVTADLAFAEGSGVYTGEGQKVLVKNISVTGVNDETFGSDDYTVRYLANTITEYTKEELAAGFNKAGDKLFVDVGEQGIRIEVTFNDNCDLAKNYEKQTFVDVTMTVLPGPADINWPQQGDEENYKIAFIYGDKGGTLNSVGLNMTNEGTVGTFAWKDDADEKLAAGEYQKTLVYTPKDPDHYQSEEKTYTVVVTQDTVTVSASEAVFAAAKKNAITYNGDANEISVTAQLTSGINGALTAEDFSIDYTLAKDGEFIAPDSENAKALTNAGSYTLTAKVTLLNKNFAFAGGASSLTLEGKPLTIAKADAEGQPYDAGFAQGVKTKTYDAEAATLGYEALTIKGVKGVKGDLARGTDYTVAYSVTKDGAPFEPETADGKPTFKDAGEYTVTPLVALTGAAENNYTFSKDKDITNWTIEEGVKLTVGKADATAALDPAFKTRDAQTAKTVVYDTKSYEIVPNFSLNGAGGLTAGTDYTVTFALTDAQGNAAEQATDAGSYALTAKVTMLNANFNALTDTTATGLTIEQAEAAAVLEASFGGEASSTFTGAAQSVAHNVTVIGAAREALSLAAGDYSVVYAVAKDDKQIATAKDGEALTLTDAGEYTVTATVTLLKDTKNYKATTLASQAVKLIVAPASAKATFAPALKAHETDGKDAAEMTYDGKRYDAVSNFALVGADNKPLTEGEDYAVTYTLAKDGAEAKEIKDAGTYTITATPEIKNPNYAPVAGMAAQVTVKRAVAGISLTAALENGATEAAYNGSAQKIVPALTVAGVDGALTAEADYSFTCTLDYTSGGVTTALPENSAIAAQNVGEYKVNAKVTLTNSNYVLSADGETTLTVAAANSVKITPNAEAAKSVAVTSATLTYDGAAHTAKEMAVTVDGKAAPAYADVDDTHAVSIVELSTGDMLRIWLNNAFDTITQVGTLTSDIGYDIVKVGADGSITYVTDNYAALTIANGTLTIQPRPQTDTPSTPSNDDNRGNTTTTYTPVATPAPVVTPAERLVTDVIGFTVAANAGTNVTVEIADAEELMTAEEYQRFNSLSLTEQIVVLLSVASSTEISDKLPGSALLVSAAAQTLIEDMVERIESLLESPFKLELRQAKVNGIMRQCLTIVLEITTNGVTTTSERDFYFDELLNEWVPVLDTDRVEEILV